MMLEDCKEEEDILGAEEAEIFSWVQATALTLTTG